MFESTDNPQLYGKEKNVYFYNKTVSVNRIIGGIKYVCETCEKPTSSSVTIEEEFNCVVTKGSSKNTYEGKRIYWECSGIPISYH